MLPDRASTKSRRYLARRRTFPKARWPATVGEKSDFLKRTKSKSKSYPVEVLERIDSSPQRQTQSHALGNLTSLLRAPAKHEQWPCSSSSFLLLLVLELVEFSRTRDEDETTNIAGRPLTQLHSWGNLTSLLRAPRNTSSGPVRPRPSSSYSSSSWWSVSRTRDEDEHEEDQYRRIMHRWSLRPFLPSAWAFSTYSRKFDPKNRILRGA